jgi:hypothetical protein
MPFEPRFPDQYSNLFHGDMKTTVTDPHGIPDSTIISRADDWHLQVDWNVNGALVGAIAGTWHVRCYLESMGPGPEVLVASADVALNGGNNYSRTFIIPVGTPPQAGAYKLVTVITFTNVLGNPGLFAGYDEFGLLQFYDGPALP